MSKTITRGIAAVAFGCLPILSPVFAADREPVPIHVSTRGIDLASPQGHAIMDARIRNAANRACISSAVGMMREQDERQCRAEMIRDGAAQLAALSGPRDVQVAALKR